MRRSYCLGLPNPGDTLTVEAEFGKHRLGVLADAWDIAHHRLLVREGERRQHGAHRAVRRADLAPAVPGLKLHMVPDVDRLVQAAIGDAGGLQKISGLS